MTKKVVSLVLAMMLILSNYAFANGNDFSVNQVKGMDKIRSQTYIKNSSELEPLDENPLKENEGLYSDVSLRESNFMANRDGEGDGDSNENTDPNHALYIAPNTGVNGVIAKENEIRWYITQLNDKSKVKWYMTLSETQNLDIFLFKFNEEENKLDFINSSGLAIGKNEALDNILEAGIYFISVEAKKGVGNFTLYNFTSTLDVNNEFNDTIDNATEISQARVVNVSGIIDNPFDIDIYKFNVEHEETSKIEFTSPEGTNYSLLYFDGQETHQVGEYMTFPVGTNYLIVASTNGDFSQTKSYSLKKTIINDTIHSKLLAISPDHKYLVTYRPNENKYYVNDTQMDFSYLYTHSFSDGHSGTHSTTRMSVDERSDTYVHIDSDEGYDVRFGSYTTTFPNNRSINNCIKLTVNKISGYMYRSSSGLHSGPQANYHFSYATLIIDANTGKVYDLLEPNYFYENSNHHSTFNPRK